jgi:3-mercaptopyruvate sulfurtransferase SseA
MPLNHLIERVEELPKNRSLLVCCAGGDRSSMAASLLQRSGFEHVCELAGGIAAWEAAGVALARLGISEKQIATPQPRPSGSPGATAICGFALQ